MRTILAAFAAFALMIGVAQAASLQLGDRFDYNSAKSTDRPFAYAGEQEGRAHGYQEVGGKRGLFLFDAQGNWDAIKYPGKALKLVKGPRFVRLDGPATYAFTYADSNDGSQRSVSCNRNVTNGEGAVVCNDLKAGASFPMIHTYDIAYGITARYTRKNGASGGEVVVWSLLPTGERIEIANVLVDG